MILLVDKPAGMTSQHVVSRIKHAHPTKLKIGHTGTLDPMCTGLLPVLTGKDTKLNQFFPHTKSYLATIRFGLCTTTGDVTGETLRTSGVPLEAAVRAVLPTMVGVYMQVPPMYSAVHVDGQRLYELARQGMEVDREARRVELFDLTYLDQLNETDYCFSVTCSSGTYIRTLCEDIGERLGFCATMAALRRTKSNGFSLDDAYSLDVIQKYAEEGMLKDISISAEQAFSYLPSVTVHKSGEHYYCNGGALTRDRFQPFLKEEGVYRVYGDHGRFLGLLSYSQGSAKSAFLAED